MNLFERCNLRLSAALVFGVAAVALPSAHAQNYHFETIAGNFDGEGGPAVQAHLRVPAGIAFDAYGNLFITENAGHRIRKVGPDGRIETVAGTGVPGYSEQPAHAPSDTSALGRLNWPQSLLFDGQGNLYFTDLGNNRVRKLWADGRTTLVAGNGSSIFGGDGGQAVNAGIGQPYGLALDHAGNLYIAEYSNSRVRKVAQNGIITTVAGNGIAGSDGDGGPAVQANLAFPMGIGLDSHDNLFIADSGTGRIRKVTPSGQISTFLETGEAMGISFDPDDNLYLSRSCGIDKVKPDGTMEAFVQDPRCVSISSPEGMAFSQADQAFFVDSSAYRVYRKDAGIAKPVPVAGRGSFFGDGGAAVNASLSRPNGVALDGVGRICIADTNFNNRIRIIDADGGIRTIAGTGFPVVAEDAEGIPATQASFSFATDCKVDNFGNVYIADAQSERVRKITADGRIRTFAGNGELGYSGDGGLAVNASLNYPDRVAIDTVGNVFIADRINNRIRKVDTAGIITTVAGNGTKGFSGDGGPAANAALSGPRAVALDAAGNLYIADTGNRRVRKVTPAGIITTVAGNGQSTQTGDGGPAVNAAIGSPNGIAIAPNGDLFVASGQLRRVDAADGRISTVAGLLYPATDVAVGDDGAVYVSSSVGRVLRGVPKTDAALTLKY